MKEITRVALITAVILAAFLGACSWLNTKMGLKQDNLVEESIEAVIEHHTGLDIDLTPGSAED